jgi:hypothetical protein
MSALGQKRTCAVQEPMSALPPKATSNATYGNVRFGSKADIRAAKSHVRLTLKSGHRGPTAYTNTLEGAQESSPHASTRAREGRSAPPQAEPVRRVGFLSILGPDDPEAQARRAVFEKTQAQL